MMTVTLVMRRIEMVGGDGGNYEEEVGNGGGDGGDYLEESGNDGGDGGDYEDGGGWKQ